MFNTKYSNSVQMTCWKGRLVSMQESGHVHVAKDHKFQSVRGHVLVAKDHNFHWVRGQVHVAKDHKFQSVRGHVHVAKDHKLQSVRGHGAQITRVLKPAKLHVTFWRAGGGRDNATATLRAASEKLDLAQNFDEIQLANSHVKPYRSEIHCFL